LHLWVISSDCVFFASQQRRRPDPGASTAPAEYLRNRRKFEIDLSKTNHYPTSDNLEPVRASSVTPTTSASACQCLGCGRPSQMRPADQRETEIRRAITDADKEASSG
jgi:hypothetical protein